jgi:hypothetical protein
MIFLGRKVRPVRRADSLPPSFRRLSRQCPYRPPRPVAGITYRGFESHLSMDVCVCSVCVFSVST